MCSPSPSLNARQTEQLSPVGPTRNIVITETTTCQEKLSNEVILNTQGALCPAFAGLEN